MVGVDPFQGTAVAVPCLSGTLKFLIEECTLLVSAAIAFLAIFSAARQNRRRATIDLLAEQNKREDLRAARRTIKAASEQDPNLARFASDVTSEEWKAITLVLNAYEFVAVGVREDAFDDRIYKRLRYNQLAEDWNRLKGFVVQMRLSKKRPTLFQEFEWLYDRSQRDPLKQNKK